MAALSGMTGFARLSGEAEGVNWAWEAKSVNGRGLDLRLNLPPGFEALERPIKQAASERFSRGSLQLVLRLEPQAAHAGVVLNEPVLDALCEAYRARTRRPSVRPLELAILMTARAVVDAGAVDLRKLAASAALNQALLAGGQLTLGHLAEARLEEGQVLAGVLGGLVAEMEAKAGLAYGLAAAQPGLVRSRLEKQLADIQASGKVDAERLAAEAALAAARADVREELDRLGAHLASARSLLATAGPAGRKLDFLSQELNREANTLCSKSVSMELTETGLALKALIDQFKEQAANVE